MDDILLSTHDNPYNPFLDFLTWFVYDLQLGHNTSGLLASRAATSDAFGDDVNDEIIKEAMKDIVKDYPVIYRIVTPEDYKATSINKDS